MGRRVYQSEASNVATAGTGQDIVALKAGASNGCQLHWLQVTVAGVTAAATQSMVLMRKTTTAALGSGGSSGTIITVDEGDAAATAGSTVHFNDTTPASGTSQNLKAFLWNMLLPFDYMPGPEDEDRDTLGLGHVLNLNTAAAWGGSASNVSAFITWREYP